MTFKQGMLKKYIDHEAAPEKPRPHISQVEVKITENPSVLLRGFFRRTRNIDYINEGPRKKNKDKFQQIKSNTDKNEFYINPETNGSKQARICYNGFFRYRIKNDG
ncbi:hypothetical protein AYI68_g1741 [Smittium mucronatum]|uniref:Uncharacterized protein n=1 Tax=Smittium mucronatum TaxID=133383 RepID=A0A1R0H4H8_9FUNG|nr:hypothetical protein AYI68_g1741 [Smittium mucronatum]